ncbi:MAG: FAD/NAD(P)-binding protein [Actinobacteria bacterium]|nr:FAD/NAD(P)-binding protein [Actinomycetota bacterium]
MQAVTELPTINPMAPVPHEVVGKRRETYDTMTLELAAPEPFESRPGQFNMLYPFGIGECAISISGDPSRTDRIVHTIRDVGAVTHALHALDIGDHVGVRGPFGTPWPMEAAEGKDLVIVAGGIGLAPVRPAIYEALNHRDRYEQFVLLYGARSPEDLVYLDEIKEWRSRFDAHVDVSVDSAPSGYRGSVGVVTRLIPSADFDPEHAVAFVIGPEIMMRFSVTELRALGMPRDQIYISMERNMQCAVGFCGHCQFGNTFVCRDGAVFCYDDIHSYLPIKEV